MERLKIAGIEWQIVSLKRDEGQATEEELKIATIRNKAEQELAEEQRQKSREAIIRARIQEQIKRRELSLTDKLLTYDKRIAELQEIGESTVADRLLLAQLDEDKLRLQKKEYEKQLEIVSEYKEELELKNKIKQIDIEILKNLYKQDRILHPINDAWYKLLTTTQDVNELISDLTVQLVTGIGGGIGDMGWDLASGFQSAKTEGKELEHELGELQEEYRILSEHKFLTQDDVDRMKEINNEMSELQSQIDKTKDYTYQLKKAFKDWAKNLIDDIGKVISRWLAMQLVMSAMGWAAPTGTPITLGAGTRTTSVATGGVLPTIKAFKEFSQGGITGRPTLALLGDNQSGRELVIPEENIRSNEVSGYVSQRGDVYIANFLQEEDIVAAMAGTMGKNVVLNHVIKAKDKKGATWRRV
jgi:hypothetical protein